MKRFAADNLFSSTKAHLIKRVQDQNPLPYFILSEGNLDLFHDLTYFFQEEPLELIGQENNLDIEGMRFKVIKSFQQRIDPPPLLVTIKALFDPLPNPKNLDFISLALGQDLCFDPFLFHLESIGLTRKKLL